LQGEEINTLIEAETKTHVNTAKSTKTWLNIFNERKLQRNEVRRFEDIPPEELDAILCRFFAEIRKKDGKMKKTKNSSGSQVSSVNY